MKRRLKRMSREFWEERYGNAEFVYGKLPNKYFKEKIDELSIGKALFAAEGEGRNAVYAASLGWEVTAFDQSLSAKIKALKLAENNKVSIDYLVSDLSNFNYKSTSFDLLVLIFVHFPEEKRRIYHRQLTQTIRKGGYIILEAFSKNHINNQKENPKVGGPKNADMLYDLGEIKEDFQNFEFLEAYETETELNEGEHHKGKGSIIRILAKKMNEINW